jgi:hypothetical protein
VESGVYGPGGTGYLQRVFLRNAAFFCAHCWRFKTETHKITGVTTHPPRRSRAEICSFAANARWADLTPEQRKIERAKGREPYPRCPCGKWGIKTAIYRGHKCEAPRAPKFETEPAARKKAAN